MRREKRKNNNENEKKKWISVIGFLISITLLSIAIILSINEESSERTAKINKNVINNSEITSNLTKVTGSELSKTVNEVKNNITNNEISENNTNNQTNIVATTKDNEDNNKNDDKTGKDNDKKNESNNNNTNKTKDTPVVEQFIKPVEGEIIKEFSVDSLVYSDTLQEWITHRGIDIKAEKTTVVKSSAAGTVKSIRNDPRYGLSITIEHDDGFTTVYSSLLSSEFVKEGEKVTQGQSIGTVGNSAVFESADGMHLHFEIIKNGEYINPEIYIK